MAFNPEEWIWVRDKSTKHQYPIHEMSFVKDAHEKLDKPAVDAAGELLPAKPHLTPTQAKELKESEGNA